VRAADVDFVSLPVAALAVTLLTALIGAVVAPWVRVRLEEQANARRRIEEAEARRKQSEADEDAASAEFMRGQVRQLQGEVAALRAELDEVRRLRDEDAARIRDLLALQEEGESDSRARDGRISQLEAAMRDGGLTVPPPEPAYRRLLERERTPPRGNRAPWRSPNG